MPNLELVAKTDVSSFRKIAIGTWHEGGDPSVYGTMEVNMDEAMRYLADFRARFGRKLTISHMMAKVAAMALKEVPDANAVLRFNRIYLRKRIGIFFQVVMTDEGAGKTDLSGATVYDVERKSLLEIISFFSYTLNLDLRWAGIPSDPFGSIMITNVGSLGLDTAYVPLVPYARVPILLALGNVRDAPVVSDGKLVVGKTMKVNATFDHRFIDGFHASVLSRVVRDWFEHPYQRFDTLDQMPAAVSKSAAAA